MENVITRMPRLALRPWVNLLWASHSHGTNLPYRERLLPSGSMHLVFRLSSDPIRTFDSLTDFEGHTFRCGIVGGIRAGFYVKESSPAGRTVGAMLQPGVSHLLFGVNAHELGGRHTDICDLWGSAARDLHSRLGEIFGLNQQLDIFESFLQSRLGPAPEVHPAIAHALKRFSSTNSIREIVEETGYSHRRFIELFRRNVGLSPRLFSRVQRLQKVFKALDGKSSAAWADLAIDAGYADQSHFNREFREFTGLSPTGYLKMKGRGGSLHVPVNFVQYKDPKNKA